MDKETEKFFRKVVGQRIRSEREERFILMAELAEYAEIDEKNLGKIERGERKPNIVTYTKIAKALNMSLDELLGEAKEIPKIMPREEIERLHKQRRPKNIKRMK